MLKIISDGKVKTKNYLSKQKKFHENNLKLSHVKP